MSCWSPKLTMKFIEALRSRPLLWDPKDEDYRNRFARNQAWDLIAAHVNMSRRDVEMKLHNLRSQFRREHNKKIEALSSGSSWSSKWFAFDALKFLVDKDVAGNTSMSMDLPTESMSEHDLNVKNEMIYVREEDPEPEFLESEPEENYVLESTSNTSRSLKRKWKEDSVIAENDEFSIYGKYVASELKSLKDEHSMIMAKHYISIILTKARLGKYRQKETIIENSDNDSS